MDSLVREASFQFILITNKANWIVDTHVYLGPTMQKWTENPGIEGREFQTNALELTSFSAVDTNFDIVTFYLFYL
jgi:hypothetical protein